NNIYKYIWFKFFIIFKLHRLPTPRPGQVLGLIGTNGIGKSTALKILAGKLKPNLGQHSNPPDWEEILRYFRGSELQNYFTKVLEDSLKAIVKPQYVDHIPRTVQGPVKVVNELLDSKLEKNNKDEIIEILDLKDVLGREIDQLSGGELQRFAIAIICIQKADIYMFDEPSFLIIFTLPFSVREGINVFLDGNIPTENLRFRNESLQFKISDSSDMFSLERNRTYSYPSMTKKLGDFTLEISAGEFTDSEIIVMLGENGTGKTTFIKLLAGILKPDGEEEVPTLSISLKPQKITPKFQGTVRMLFFKKIKSSWLNPSFQSDVCKPLNIENIIDQEVQNLSGGELQRVAIVLCLGLSADIYLIDEPSAYLDSEQRIIASKVIKRFILHSKKTAFVVEHDLKIVLWLHT
ncbi:hypothetical protein PORY_001772, partial [Pneumocystis oryctolagi]